jgi:hypothetical protein
MASICESKWTLLNSLGFAMARRTARSVMPSRSAASVVPIHSGCGASSGFLCLVASGDGSAPVKGRTVQGLEDAVDFRVVSA